MTYSYVLKDVSVDRSLISVKEGVHNEKEIQSSSGND